MATDLDLAFDVLSLDGIIVEELEVEVIVLE
jgi:hypothetical protein